MSELALDSATATGRFRALAEAASDGIIVIDEQSRILFVNPAVREIFGHPVDAMIGRDLTILLPERFRERHRHGLARYLATGDRHIPWHGVELPGLHASGREIRLEISFGEHREGDRRVFAGVVRDVTDRRAEELRRRTEHAVARILAEAPDEQEALQRVLTSMCDTLEWEIGMLWIVEEDDGALELLATCGEPALEPFVAASRKYRFRRGKGLPGRIWRSGEPHWIVDVGEDENYPRAGLAANHGLTTAFGFPLTTRGRVIAVMEFLSGHRRDPDPALLDTMAAIGSQIGQYLVRVRAEERGRELLRREKEARERAEAAAQSRDQVMAVVSHDLRNYLQSLLTNLGVVDRGVPESGPVRRRLEAMGSALAAMGRLIDDLLEVRRLEEGSLVLDWSDQRPLDLVRAAISPYQPILEEERGLTIDVPEDLPRVRCDRQRSIQVLSNLLQNAVKHTEGPVEVGARLAGDAEVEIFVKDHGPGIQAEDLPHLFDRFWQAGRSRPGNAGSGLGLAIVKGLVEAQGGTIHVESDPGAGSVFGFTLPRARP